MPQEIQMWFQFNWFKTNKNWLLWTSPVSFKSLSIRICWYLRTQISKNQLHVKNLVLFFILILPRGSAVWYLLFIVLTVNSWSLMSFSVPFKILSFCYYSPSFSTSQICFMVTKKSIGRISAGQEWLREYAKVACNSIKQCLLCEFRLGDTELVLKNLDTT